MESVGNNLLYLIIYDDSNFGKFFFIKITNKNFNIFRPYNIQKDSKVLSAFNNFADFLQEEETWERSFKIKPRIQRQKQKIAL